MEIYPICIRGAVGNASKFHALTYILARNSPSKAESRTHIGLQNRPRRGGEADGPPPESGVLRKHPYRAVGVVQRYMADTGVVHGYVRRVD